MLGRPSLALQYSNCCPIGHLRPWGWDILVPLSMLKKQRETGRINKIGIHLSSGTFLMSTVPLRMLKRALWLISPFSPFHFSSDYNHRHIGE